MGSIHIWNSKNIRTQIKNYNNNITEQINGLTNIKIHDNQRYQLANYNVVVDIWEYENFSETNWKDDRWRMRILPRFAHAPFVQIIKEIWWLCRLFGSAPSFFFSSSSSSSSRNNQRFYFVCSGVWAFVKIWAKRWG